MRLAEPGWLVLSIAALIPLRRLRAGTRLRWPDLGGFEGRPAGIVARTAWLPAAMRSVAIVLLVVALGRPRTVGGVIEVRGRGAAIVAAIDRSRSMMEEVPGGAGAGPGARPRRRIDEGREAFEGFVEGRPDDLIGLIVFANEPDRLAAPTVDHRHLIDLARSIRPAPASEDGTNLGYAITQATADLAATSPARRVLILVSDGEDRPAVARPIDPRKAAEIARALGITTYAVAVGGPAGSPASGLLAEVAAIGGGRAFRAGGPGSLAEILGEISGLERSPVRGTVRTRYREDYAPFVAAALALLALERVASAGRWRRPA